MNDRRIDRLLGLRAADVDRRLVLSELLRREGSEQFDYCGTPYDIIRQVVAWAALTPDDVFYDLGAGFGRVLLYGTLTSDARFRGIEVVRERVLEINRVLDRLQLRRVDVRHGNVSDVDVGDGTVFFLFNPFFTATRSRVFDMLHRLSRTRRLRIATVALSDRYLSTQPWLVDDPRRACGAAPQYALRLFTTR